MKVEMSTLKKSDKKAALDFAAWSFNVTTSVGIIMVNKALMATYGFSFGMSVLGSPGDLIICRTSDFHIRSLVLCVSACLPLLCYATAVFCYAIARFWTECCRHICIASVLSWWILADRSDGWSYLIVESTCIFLVQCIFGELTDILWISSGFNGALLHFSYQNFIK